MLLFNKLMKSDLMDMNDLIYTKEEGFKKFLEENGLYTKFKLTEPIETIHDLYYPSVQLYCKRCNSKETFIFQRKTTPFKGVSAASVGPNVINIPSPPEREVLDAEYKCAGCGKFTHHFLIELDENHNHILKAGQTAELNIKLDKNIKKLLGSKIEFYKKGLICESQGYGIGAFVYYRRVVEELIDEIIGMIKNILQTEDEKTNYLKAVNKIQESHNAQDKIDLIKKQLPNSLSEKNYFKIIYSSVSVGIHSLNDEECLDFSVDLKKAILSLINHLKLYKIDEELNESTKKLLEKTDKYK